MINTAFGNISNAGYAALRTRLEAAGMSCAPGSTLPDPPSAEDLQRLRDLGYQNYQKYGADPVSFSTGNFINLVNFFTIPGRGGMNFDFSLTYNTQDGRDDIFGYGWSMPYNSRLEQYSDDSVSVMLLDGRTYHFTWNGSAYEAPATSPLPRDVRAAIRTPMVTASPLNRMATTTLPSLRTPKGINQFLSMIKTISCVTLRTVAGAKSAINMMMT